MAQTDTQKLDAHDRFPSMPLKLADGEELALPDDMLGTWWIFLVYRGHW